jgi:CRISPR-associated endonuclease/helicase Cas3
VNKEEEMPRIDEETKARRKELVWLEVRQHNGIRQIDIAEKLKIENRTVNNYLRELEEEGKVIKEGVLWYSLPYQETRLRRFSLSPEEAMTLYLATRLLVKQQDKRNEPAESALYRLAEVLTSDANVGHEIRQAAQELAQRPADPQYRSIFREIIRGYIYRRKVEIRYLPLKGPEFETTFATFLIEPSAIGFSTYIIGHSKSQYVDDIRSYKMERILSAAMKNETYSVPPKFPGLDILRNAWSIISGEKTERIILRFSPGEVSRRVLETQWHPSQQHMPDPEKPGYLRWWVEIADTTDMKPWIRSWGADVEVIEPKGLRAALIREATKLVRIYRVEVVLELQEAGRMFNDCSFYAHSKEGLDKSEWQCLKEHLVNTANLAAGFGRSAGVAELARVAGLIHDIGKYSTAFQKRLEGAKHKVDHSTAGAREIITLFKDKPQKALAEMLAYCIAGHHTGLPDYGSKADMEGKGTLLARLDRSKLEDYSAYKAEIDPETLVLPERLSLRPAKNYRGKRITGFSMSFLTRMVFSALVDADFQETETYMGGRTKPRGGYASIAELRQAFNHFLQTFDNPVGEINRKRTDTLQACVGRSSDNPGFFTLTVPTGGGKTLSSMAFALNHAVAHSLERIIYVIPFTTIIEQNAAVFKQCLGEENVLEHHSNFDWERKGKVAGATADDLTNSAARKLKLATENWDIPIVVTTNVQFFESLFANRSSHCRKLHNLAKSVIVFDEAQMLPREYLEPCMYAVQELVQNYGSSAVFCTATQPSLKRFLAPDVQLTELVPYPQGLFDFYRRVQVKSKGKLADEGLLEELRAHSQVLCIVNTRRHAKGLFDGLASLAGEGCFHLSTLMCPAHRKEVLATIRERLTNDKPCRVVSTQVMEAGIDVDFPVGYRALAGLDSIIQAAGRVNREGKQAMGEICVFEPETSTIKRTPAFVGQGAAVSTSILRQFSTDPISIEAIDAYFKLLYGLQGEGAFDAKAILPCFEKGLAEVNFDFKTAAERFKLIDNDTVSVIVPYNEEARQLIEELKYTLYPATTLRKLQMYTVNIYEYEFEKLQSKGVIETQHERFHVLNGITFYERQTGLVIPADAGGDAIFIDV